MKKCPRCGFENQDNAFFCERCRYPLSPSTPFPLEKCPRCGFENPSGSSICERCKYPLVPPSVQLTEEESTVVNRGDESYLRLSNGAMYLALGVTLLLLTFIPTNFVVENLFGFVAVVLIGLGIGSYSLGFRLLDRRYKNSSIMSIFLLPGFLLMLSGVGLYQANVAPSDTISKNLFLIALIDVGYLVYLVGSFSIALGLIRLSRERNRRTLLIASVVTLVGLVALPLQVLLGVFLIVGQIITYSELKKRTNTSSPQV
ncbi:zinc-ribbon domain-containing protein [Metallosphaera tengchongensis]|uniref:Zinc-ribbon domain-containing protein n=1 Tax=Metallosphaera tengchongensis TaxID=1532350 RepID=A0A6N0NTN4_9CREN|nr:zinc ribbon domain-containing protein [Metallosphaera tengchongensis]QKR00136.1 zinc-ribbon domain-containing protein [Metallosphaera tengchongensis]